MNSGTSKRLLMRIKYKEKMSIIRKELAKLGYKYIIDFSV